MVTYTRPCVGSAIAWNEKSLKKALPWKLSLSEYVAARLRPAKSRDKKTEETESFISRGVE